MRPSRPRRPKLRTRVLASVLLIMLAALAAFDVAAVAALRGYLLSQTDAQLQDVLSLYRPLYLTHAGFVSGGRLSGPPQVRGKYSRPVQIIGPRLEVPAVLGQYFVGSVSRSGPRLLVGGNADLRPRLPADLRALATSHRAQTVTSINGRDQLRLRAETFSASGTVYAVTSLSDVSKTVGQLQLIVAFGSAAAALLAAGGVAWVVRRGLRPVEKMAAQADRVTAGDLAGRVSPHDPRTEVGRLGMALNGMLARIEAAVGEREASQELTQRFFADASHELRNPLASLRANAELYQQGALRERPQVDEAMRRIGLEARRMSSLVDDMLRLARLDQHPGRERQPVDLTALVTECVGRAGVAGQRRTWQTNIATGLEVDGDEELLRRAIDNLLANVQAHTPAGATASVTAAADDGRVTISVSDDGPGVPADQLPRLFERFYRAPAQPGAPGSGLGLAIVSAIAGAHDGSAAATLNVPRGLSVTLTLPSPPALRAGARAPSAGRPAARWSSPPPPATGPPPPPAGPGTA